jgi:hypothetical protein
MWSKIKMSFQIIAAVFKKTRPEQPDAGSDERIAAAFKIAMSRASARKRAYLRDVATKNGWL